MFICFALSRYLGSSWQVWAVLAIAILMCLECRHAGSTGQLPPGQGLFGSPAYMAPEQIKACLQRRDGMPRGPLYGAAADCWAFGLTIFELLTGQTLFGAKTEAPREEWEHVEKAREFHERQIAAEHQSWVRNPTAF